MWVDILWLLLFVAILGVMWAAIKGAEWMIEYTKQREHFMRVEKGVVEKLTEKEELEYLAELERRDRIDMMVNWENWPEDFENASPTFKQEFNQLTADELCEVILRRREKNVDTVANGESIKTTKSALKNPLENKLVVKNSRSKLGIKSPLTKQAKREEKIFKQIKKRYTETNN
ncbi:MAG: hypothetical protein LBQ05_02575 [Christensenellaceae bacterium]|jgi:hypothetical protein|nr:hypothetical protein [Christensenellaceae bacterium]